MVYDGGIMPQLPDWVNIFQEYVAISQRKSVCRYNGWAGQISDRMGCCKQNVVDGV
jgi:hypothetical protein